MQRFFLHIFDWVQRHRGASGMLFVLLVCVCVFGVTRLHFKEEITDFLPVTDQYKESLRIYHDVASADKIVLQFSSSMGKDSILAAVDAYGTALEELDTAGWIADYSPQIDYMQVMDVVEFVYGHLPYYLDSADYVRMDSLLSQPDYIDQRLQWMQGQMESLTGSFMLPVLRNDPLGMGVRFGKTLEKFQPETAFVQEDGYIFTPDGQSCLVTIESPFGSSETKSNGQLVKLLTDAAGRITPSVSVELIGAPVVAVENARQIRHDTLLALSVSVVLILVLLLGYLKGLRSLWHITLSVAFGFLISVAGLSVFSNQLSLIVIGIASVIIGIAINYPLHFVCHSQELVRDNPGMNKVETGRRVLSDLVKPLLIGNITTVGAFLTLVPLKAVAIRQLGLFCALMLVGTILFVLVIMPHFRPAFVRTKEEEKPGNCTDKLSWLDRLVKHPASLIVLTAITLVLGCISLRTTFDSDISHLNYMTEAQRENMAKLSVLQGQKSGVPVYVATTNAEMERLRQTLDELKSRHLLADEKNPADLLPSKALQERRLRLWSEFWSRHDYMPFLSESRTYGFSEEAFEPFQLQIEEDLRVLEYEDFLPLTSSVLTGYSNPHTMVTRLTVKDLDTAQKVEAVLNAVMQDGRAFDLTTINSSITRTLTDDFNYIGVACAFIVFLFLWISFRRIELALLAFAPMVIGWLWILGIMQIFGIQFNIVNIILATFIFGQGDDYTIFVTEGLIKDFKQNSGHKVLIGYQRSILLSAAIMLVGIGSLILAKHPALHSLAEVTIIGMGVVVVMAWLVPPMLFHWLIKIDKPLRNYLLKH